MVAQDMSTRLDDPTSTGADGSQYTAIDGGPGIDVIELVSPAVTADPGEVA